MGKMEATLRSEIGRLSRRELRATVGPLKKDVVSLKRLVSKLSKQVVALQKITAATARQRQQQVAKLEVPEERLKASRMSAGLIKKLRRRLGLTQAELAGLTNVSTAAVVFWESGRSAPRGENRVALVALRGLGRREVRQMLIDKGALSPRKAAKLGG